MVKKRKVPEWLNSSLWSTPPHHDPLSPRHVSNSTTTTSGYDYSPESSPIRPPILEPKPDPPHHPRPSRVQISDDGGSSPSSPFPAVVDISRQAFLLQELSRKVIDMGEVHRAYQMVLAFDRPCGSSCWGICQLIVGFGHQN